MNNITELTCGIMRPVYDEWDKKARLSAKESDILCMRYFERRSLLYVCNKTHYSEQSVVAIYNKAVEKINNAIKISKL